MLSRELLKAAEAYSHDLQNNDYEKGTFEWDLQEFELRYAFLAGAKWAANHQSYVYDLDFKFK